MLRTEPDARLKSDDFFANTPALGLPFPGSHCSGACRARRTAGLREMLLHRQAALPTGERDPRREWRATESRPGGNPPPRKQWGTDHPPTFAPVQGPHSRLKTPV
jgi:hypothetical protein